MTRDGRCPCSVRVARGSDFSIQGEASEDSIGRRSNRAQTARSTPFRTIEAPSATTSHALKRNLPRAMSSHPTLPRERAEARVETLNKSPRVARYLSGANQALKIMGLHLFLVLPFPQLGGGHQQPRDGHSGRGACSNSLSSGTAALAPGPYLPSAFNK